MLQMRELAEKVSICIPTWEAEEFIEAAIDCAERQTHGDLEILISVDRSTDGTADICRRRAESDPRIRVIEQKTRLGWTENVNALLDAVRTDYFALYFHDDRVSEHWISTLMNTLLARPDAGAAYCQIEEGGGLKPGLNHDGDAFARLMTRLVGEPKGSPLRALVRRSALPKPVRFPKVSLLGFHAQHAFLFDLIAQAPLLYTPQTLYFRQHNRSGGVTSKWRGMPPETIEADLRAAAAAIAGTISEAVADTRQRHILLQCARLCLFLQLTKSEIQYGFRRNLTPEALIPGVSDGGIDRILADEHPQFRRGFEKLTQQVSEAIMQRYRIEERAHESAQL